MRIRQITWERRKRCCLIICLLIVRIIQLIIVTLMAFYVDIYISNAKMHIILYKYGGIKLK